MIINVGSRSDIPAFFSDWFYNRIKEGFVCVRNPYYPQQVTRYKLDPQVVDLLAFCTKNPGPMLDRLDIIKDFHQSWAVTITPYDTTIEPYVPNKNQIIRSFQILSKKVGIQCMSWRYDPIFLNEKYTIDYHIDIFEKMCSKLSGYTRLCVISFIDLYDKTKRNFPDVKTVSLEDQLTITKAFVSIGKKYNIDIYTCFENEILESVGANVQGCFTKEVAQRAIGERIEVPKSIQSSRPGCHCLLNNDIGVYNTCLHGCLYCYANYDRHTVVKQYKQHNPLSPFLIGDYKDDDIIKDAMQKSYIQRQLSLF